MKRYSFLIVNIVLALLFVRLVMNYNNRYETQPQSVVLNASMTEKDLAKAIMLKNYLPSQEDADFAAAHLTSVLKKGEGLSALYDLNKYAWKIPADLINSQGSSFYRKALADENHRMGIDSAYYVLDKEALQTTYISNKGSGSIKVIVNSKNEKAGRIASLLGRDKKACPDVTVRLYEHFIDTLGNVASKTLGYAKTNAKGQAEFKGLSTSSSYSVIPIKEGFEYGEAQGTVGGTLAQVGEDGSLECKFIQKEHRVKVFDTLTLQNIKADHIITARSLRDFMFSMGVYLVIFFAAWWLFYFSYSRRNKGADKGIVSLLMALTGICLLMMFSINDPLNDKLLGVEMTQGIIAGIIIMILLQAVDFKAFYQDRSLIPFDIPSAFIIWIFKPYRLKVRRQTEILADSSIGAFSKTLSLVPIVLCLPFLILDLLQITRLYQKIDSLFARMPKGSGYMFLALLLTLLLFTPLGTAVGGMRVNLNIGILFQPSEIAKYLIVIFMAAFFCANAETIVKFSQKGNVDMFGVKMRMLGVIILGLLFLMGLYLVLGDMGPAMVLAFTFIIMYSAIKSKVNVENLSDKDTLRHILTCDLAMLVYGIISFMIMLYVGNRMGLMWLFCLLWFVLWILVGLLKKRVFESAIVFNLIIAAFIFGASILGKIPGLESVAERLEGRTEMCTNTWGTLPVDGQVADPGENTQVAEGLWGLASGGLMGQGIGKGSPSVIPAFHTDMILASIGEQFGFIGLLIVVVLIALLLRRTVLHGYRAANPFTFYICLGIAIVTGVQFIIIALGSTGIIPLTGVTVPFFSFGKVSMILNLAAFGIVLSIAGRNAETEGNNSEVMIMRRSQMLRYDYSISIISMIFCAVAILILGVFLNYTVLQRDKTLIRPVYVNNINGLPVVNYNPRISLIAEKMPVGNIYDRNGVLIASSDVGAIQDDRNFFVKDAGVDSAMFDNHMKARLRRYYPFGDQLFYMLGDYNTRLFFTSGDQRGYMAEARHLSKLRGYDDRLISDGKGVKVDLKSDEFRPGKYFRNDSSVVLSGVQLRDYSALLPALKSGEPIGTVPQDVHLTIDAVLHTQIQNRFEEYIKTTSSLKDNNYLRGSIVVLDGKSGDLLASIVYPIADQNRLMMMDDKELNVYRDGGRSDDWSSYSDMDLGLIYPTAPGSSAKVMDALAAFKSYDREDIEHLEYTYYRNERIGYEPDSTHDATRGMCEALMRSSNNYFINLVNDKDLYDELADIYSHVGTSVDEQCTYKMFYNQNNVVDSVMQIHSKGAVSKYNQYQESVKNGGPRQKLTKHPAWQLAWGQGKLAASPLAMARVASIVASGGRMPVTRYETDADTEFVDIAGLSSKDIDYLRFCMESEAKRKYPAFTVPVYSKTGTAERVFNGGKAYDGWYVGYIDGLDGPIAFAVRLERKVQSGTAVDVTRKVLIPALQQCNYVKK